MKPEHTVVHLGVDFGRIDGWIQGEGAPIIEVAGFAVNQLKIIDVVLFVPDKGQFVVFQEDFQAAFVHAGHFCFQNVPILGLGDIDSRRNESSLGLLRVREPGFWFGAIVSFRHHIHRSVNVVRVGVKFSLSPSGLIGVHRDLARFRLLGLGQFESPLETAEESFCS